MNSDRWQRIEELYREASNRSAQERAPFLDSACGGDGELRRQVEALLAEHFAEKNERDRLTVETPSELQDSTLTQVMSAGNRLGPYQIETRLGAGGMGEVFRAVDTRLGRTVAVKLLLQDRIADPALKQRFLHEARAASALNHPNIIALYDISNQSGTDFLVMEYVAGRTLRDMIPPEGLPFARVAFLGSQVASALGAAHAAGIVHRDIKPANIMVTQDHIVKVLDFGVAKLPRQENETELTMTGAVIGTVAYMSPEQTRGEAADARSDIFSLGCVLYHAATGRQPFEGASALIVMHQVATVDPPPPSSRCSDLPAEFDRLILRCLAKQSSQRPESAAELATELKALAIPERAPPKIRMSRSSVAVLPFQVRGPAADQYLSASLADAVIHRLSSAGGLVVRPIASVMRYAGKEVAWDQAARELNVDMVVEGAIQTVGTKVRVLIQTHRAADSQTLASIKQDGDMNDLFAVQDRVADSVCEIFAPREKQTGEHAIPPTKNSMAYEMYLRAVERSVRVDKFDVTSAIELLTRATDLDPLFADAWGRLAQAYAILGGFIDRDPKWFDLAEQAIARALELDPVQCDALCARGHVLFSPARKFQNVPALRALTAAIRMNRIGPVARQLRAAILWHMGYFEAAKPELEETILTNPGYVIAHASAGVVALFQGDLQKAQECTEKSLSLDPTSVIVQLLAPMTLVWAGRLGEARLQNEKGRQMFPQEPFVTAFDALFAALDGNFAKAEALADSAVNSPQGLTHTHHTWHYCAGVYALCGQQEKAVAELRRCAELGLPNHRLFLTDPHLRPLHQNMGFQSLMSTLRRNYDAVRDEFGLEG